MNNVPHISSSDLRLLRALVNHPPAGIPPPAKTALESLLKKSQPPAPENEKNFAGLGSLVFLVSPTDPRDTFEFILVAPDAENLEDNRLSVFRPICQAVLGKAKNSLVEWQLGEEIRKMIMHQIIPPTENRIAANPVSAEVS